MANQDTFISVTWGKLDFFPTKSDKWTDNCRHCLLLHSGDECLNAPCCSDERDDQRRGYFSIHQMPIR